MIERNKANALLLQMPRRRVIVLCRYTRIVVSRIRDKSAINQKRAVREAGRPVASRLAGAYLPPHSMTVFRIH